MIAIREADVGDAMRIEPFLVQDNLDRLMHDGADPVLALERLIRDSEDTFCMEEDGAVLCLGGVVPTGGGFLTAEGFLWMATTRAFDNHPKKVLFAKESRRWLNVIKERYTVLREVCQVEDNRSAVWLEYLGFEFGDPIHLDCANRDVYPVEWRR